MFHGATWTLNSNGTASFDGTVTSSDDKDAWLMHADLLDSNGAVMGSVINPNAIDNDKAKFIKGLPNHRDQYRWIVSGKIDPNLFGKINSMRLRSHC